MRNRLPSANTHLHLHMSVHIAYGVAPAITLYLLHIPTLFLQPHRCPLGKIRGVVALWEGSDMEWRSQLGIHSIDELLFGRLCQQVCKPDVCR